MKVDWCCRFGKVGDDGVGAIRRGWRWNELNSLCNDEYVSLGACCMNSGGKMPLCVVEFFSQYMHLLHYVL